MKENTKLNVFEATDTSLSLNQGTHLDIFVEQNLDGIQGVTEFKKESLSEKIKALLN